MPSVDHFLRANDNQPEMKQQQKKAHIKCIGISLSQMLNVNKTERMKAMAPTTQPTTTRASYGPNGELFTFSIVRDDDRGNGAQKPQTECD